MKIYVVAHKPANITGLNLDNCYELIRVGDYANEKSEILADNTGDNISGKNSNYCELTAMYWIWKNDTVSDIVGLCHYRRYFTKSILSTSTKHIVSEGDVRKLLRNHDIVVAQKTYSYRGAYRAYLDCGREKDLKRTREAVEKLYPDYLPYYVSEFEEAAGNYGANMLIASKKFFDEYCKWLFDILGYVERHTDLSGYSKEEARIYGYISERLLGVWTAKNRLRVKEVRIINTEQKKDTAFYVKKILTLIGLYQGAKKIIFLFRRLSGKV